MRLVFIFCVVIVLLGGITFAHTVTMNLEFNSNGSVYADSVLVTQDRLFSNMSKRYLMGFDGSAFGVVFAGSEFVSASAKFQAGRLFSMTQGNDNRFLIAFTNSTSQGIDEGYESIGSMPARTVGYLTQDDKKSFPVFLQLQYHDVDILNGFSWSGPEYLIITNKGRADGMTMVSIERK